MPKNYTVSNDVITLLIPTHNRHAYLDRILDYYSGVNFQVVVADSTPVLYKIKEKAPATLKYLHLPGETLNAKLEMAVQQVNTPFIVMCADDDFVIPSGLESCVRFLQQYKEFSCAQGNCIAYMKMPEYAKEMELAVMYKHLLSFTIADDEAYERLKRMFANYRTLFYGVHYTANLKLAFAGTAAVIKNLYLNEYITGIVPLVAGKYRELNVLYQVREFADDSGDKITVNLDAIAYEEKYAAEFAAYIELVVSKMSALLPEDKQIKSEDLSRLLRQFADNLKVETAPSFKKKVGTLLGRFPVFGRRLVRYNRRMEKAKELKMVIKNEAEARELKQVESIIRKYTSLSQ